MIPRLLLPAALALVAGAAHGQTVTCRSPGVIDGDTIVCGAERVRLFGLDAPERYTVAGPPATRAMADLTRGQTITCTRAGPRSWGRLVARCVLPGGRDLTCAMIGTGTAGEWLRFSRGEYRGCAR